MSIERIDLEKCDGCGICLDSCPNDVLRLDAQGRVAIIYPKDCHTCFLCEWDCPREAIYVSAEVPYLPTLIALASKFGRTKIV